MKMNMKKYSLWVFCTLFATAMWAQSDTSVTDQVEIFSSFNAKLELSNKLRTTPSLLPTDNNAGQALAYQLPTRLLSLTYEPPVIKPMSLPKADAPEVYRFSGKVGYGMFNQPLVHLQYDGQQRDELYYYIDARHHSANNNSRIENQIFSDTKVQAGATYMTNGLGIGGGLSYELNGRYFYGYDRLDTIDFVSDTLQQRYQVISAKAHLFNAVQNRGDIDYKADLDLYKLDDRYDGSDFGIKLDGTITKWFGEKHPFTVRLLNDFNTFNQDTARANNNILAVQPSFTYHAEQFRVKVGANAGLDSSTFAFPDIEVMYSLAGGKFNIIAGWSGEVIKNSYRNVVRQNPFVFAPLALQNTRRQSQYAGVELALNDIRILGRLANQPVQNLQLFVNDTLDARFFHTRYDDGNIFNIHGEASISKIKNLDLTATIDFNTYNLNNEARAWHLPNFESNITAIYKAVDDKLRLRASLFLLNSLPYLDEAQDVQVLTGVTDLSLGASFQFLQNVGIFLDVNNLTNSANTRWYRYPQYRFNVLTGLKARF